MHKYLISVIKIFGSWIATIIYKECEVQKGQAIYSVSQS